MSFFSWWDGGGSLADGVGLVNLFVNLLLSLLGGAGWMGKMGLCRDSKKLVGKNRWSVCCFDFLQHSVK